MLNEIRIDPISGNYVLIAPGRSQRPFEYKPTNGLEEIVNIEECPFCPGNEAKTPAELWAYNSNGNNRLPNTPGWLVRIFHNKFPALTEEGAPILKGDDLYKKIDGVGIHDIIVETPRHTIGDPKRVLRLDDLSEEEISYFLLGIKERIIDLEKDPRFKYIKVFRNYGGAAGASLQHPHSQLMALPIIPTRTNVELIAAHNYYKKEGKCIYCVVYEKEIMEKERIVLQKDGFITFAPHASSSAYKLMILPEEHNDNFKSIDGSDILNLAGIIKASLSKLNQAFPFNVPHNITFNISPTDTGKKDYSPMDIKKIYHWYIEIIPRISLIAGFEIGTGDSINPTRPEDVPKYLNGG
jgi:UDPglucose--hexose-1-phosphate uridylyltransferase